MDLFAYLDPGSASALLAAILAGIAGIGAALRTYGSNFLKRLMFWKSDSTADAGQSGQKTAEQKGEDKPANQR